MQVIPSIRRCAAAGAVVLAFGAAAPVVQAQTDTLGRTTATRTDVDDDNDTDYGWIGLLGLAGLLGLRRRAPDVVVRDTGVRDTGPTVRDTGMR